MKNKKTFETVFFTLVVVLFTACQPKTIEQQVEKLMKTDNREKRETIAVALADSLDLRAIELITGLYPNTQYAEQALEDMLSRYIQITAGYVSTNCSNPVEMAFECVGQIPTHNAAVYLGEQSTFSTNGIIAFHQIKSMSPDLKHVALLAGLKCETKNEKMQDSLLSEFYSFGQDASLDLFNNPQTVSVNALKKIIAAFLQEKETNKEMEMKSIICGLKIGDNDEIFQNSLITAAKKHGDDAMIQLINEWYKNQSKGILNAINSFGNKAILYLSNQLGKNKNAEELLAHIGKPAVNTLIAKMKNSEQDVRFAAADALVKMSKYNPNAVSNLTDAFDNKSISAIAKNYPFYIRMGLSGTEDLLLKALKTNFSKNMCVDYLNCGNWLIESNAKDIAAQHGYGVYTEHGTHYGPKWGSGN